MSSSSSFDDELLEEVQFLRKRLRETVNVFDWKHFLVPQLSLIIALVCSTFSLYRFSLVSYSLFWGSFSIMALLYWICLCFRNKREADQVEERGLEICARATSYSNDENVLKETKDLFKEIEMHAVFLNAQTSRMNSTILIFISLFMAWLIFTIGDISQSLSRYQSTIIGNIFVVLAIIFVFFGLRRK